MLEARLLGQFDVRLDGNPIELASRPAQSLFAYIILNTGHLHRREKLAGVLWPAFTESNARNNLRQALWRVRRSLQPKAKQYLIADNFAIGFNNESAYWLDVAKLVPSTPDQLTTESLCEAVDVYQGELLPGFYENWVVLERERLRVAYEQKMRFLIDRLIQERRWSDLIDWGERWIARGEAPEPAYRALMIANHNLGNVSGMASAYQRCEKALHEELAVEPSLETEALYQGLSRGEPVADLLPVLMDEEVLASPSRFPDHEPSPPSFLEEGASPQVKEAVFVARERELAQLDSQLEHSLAGNGRVFFITGDAGSGKTALMREFARRAQDMHEDLIASLGYCNALTGVSDPFLPFREAFSLFFGDVEGYWARGTLTNEQALRLWRFLPSAIESLMNLGPDLVDSLVPGPVILARARAHSPDRHSWLLSLQKFIEQTAAARNSTDLNPKNLFGQFSKLLHDLARQKPILLMLDDLQWADIGSINLLFHLGRQIGESRVLILGAFRPDDVRPGLDPDQSPLQKMLTEFKRSYGEVQIDLNIIGDEEAESFIDQFLDTEPNRLDDIFRRELLRHTGGHPLFTIELLRALEERGDILHDQERQWIYGPTLNWRELPAKVEGVIEERMNRLGEKQKEMLTVASVEGEEFTAEVLSRVLKDDILQTIGQLSGKLDKQYRLVLAQGSRRLGKQRLSLYRFRHILFQKHLYNGLDAVERAYLHEEVGSVLETLYGDRADEIALQLARQFIEAGIVEKAVGYLLAAAYKARRSSAYRDAVIHLRQALDLLHTLPAGPERLLHELTLQISLGGSFIATRGYAAPEVGQAFSRARDLCQETEDQTHLFPILYGLRTHYLVRGEYQTARELGRQLLTIAHSMEEPDLLLEAHQASGTTMFFLAEFEQARTHLERGCELYQIERHHAHAYQFGQDPCVACLGYLALISWSQGRIEEAFQQSERAISLAEQVAHPFSMALALNFASLLHRMNLEKAKALELAESAVSLCEEHGFPFWGAMGSILQGSLLAEQDHLHALTRMHRGLEIWQQLGSRLGLSLYFAMLAEAYAESGETDLGLEAVKDALEYCQATGERLMHPDLLRIQGDLKREQGIDEAQVEACYRESIRVSRALDMPSFELRAALRLYDLWQGGRKVGEGRKRVKEVLTAFGDDVETHDLRRARSILEGGSG